MREDDERKLEGSEFHRRGKNIENSFHDTIGYVTGNEINSTVTMYMLF